MIGNESASNSLTCWQDFLKDKQELKLIELGQH